MAQIHPTAIVDPGAEIASDAQIGPYCVIGPHARVGAGTRLFSHVVLQNHISLGPRCEVHPFASLGGLTQDKKFKGGAPRVEVGAETVIREYVTINTATNDGDATRVGSKVLIMAYAHVAHDCIVGDEVIMANGVTLAGHVEVEPQAIIGGLSAVHQFVRIGRLSIIGGMSRVVQDVPPFMMAAEIPLRVPTINAIGLQRRGISEDTQKALRKAHHIIYRENLTLAEAIARIAQEWPDLPEIAHLVNFLKSAQRGIVR